MLYSIKFGGSDTVFPPIIVATQKFLSQKRIVITLPSLYGTIFLGCYDYWSEYSWYWWARVTFFITNRYIPWDGAPMKSFQPKVLNKQRVKDSVLQKSWNIIQCRKNFECKLAKRKLLQFFCLFWYQEGEKFHAAPSSRMEKRKMIAEKYCNPNITTFRIVIFHRQNKLLYQ